MKIIFFDVETTGVKFWKNGIHQLSGLVEINGTIVETFDYKVQPNPSADIEQEALDVANVTKEQILAYPDMGIVYMEFTTLLGKYCNKFDKSDKFFLIGFNNASFDNAFLRAFFVQNGDNYFGSWFWANPIDAYVLASHKLMKERKDMPDFKLKTACVKLGIDVDETKLHDAVYDVMLTRELYKRVTSNNSVII